MKNMRKLLYRLIIVAMVGSTVLAGVLAMFFPGLTDQFYLILYLTMPLLFLYAVEDIKS